MATAAPSFMRGQSEKNALRSEAFIAERQAKDVKLQRTQESAMRQEQLRSVLSTIEARRAASGVGSDSPTALAIERAIVRQSHRDQSISRAGAANQIYALMVQAQAKRKAAKQAGQIGMWQAFNDVASTAAKAMGAG